MTSKTISIPLYVHTRVNRPGDDYLVSSLDMSSCGYLLVETRAWTYDPPEPKTLVPQAVLALRDKQTELRARAQSECGLLEEQIQTLLCLEFDPGDVASDA